MRSFRLCVFCFVGMTLFGAADPFVGLWKLDNEKSKFPPGAPRLMSATILVEPDGKGLKSTANAINGDGGGVDLGFNCTLDGTTCKQISSLPLRGPVATDAVTLKRID